jgi:ABC-2 type transport system ATP-binding protein
MYGIKRKDEDAHCMYWLEKFSVAQNAKRNIRQLSKGNVQRVALAHAMAVEPRLLVLDEPLSGLDPVGRKDVIDILEAYKQQGGAIFFTSHVLHDVERIADRFGFINEGELLTTRSPRELVTEHADRFVVRYHVNDNSSLQGTPLRENEYKYELAQSELPQWLEQLNRANGKALEIKHAVSLESVFFKILEEKKQGPTNVTSES